MQSNPIKVLILIAMVLQNYSQNYTFEAQIATFEIVCMIDNAKTHTNHNM